MTAIRSAAGSQFPPRAGDGIDHARTFLEQNIPICAGMLSEAQKLVRSGQVGPTLNPFVLRAGELLEELDELLVALDAGRDGAILASIATLHQSLDAVRSAMAMPPPGPKPRPGAAASGR